MFGLGGRRTEQRIEPRLDDFVARAAAAATTCAPTRTIVRLSRRTLRQKQMRRGAARRSASARRGARCVGRLAYWRFVLAVWGAVAVAGLLIYYASQLPPIDQLAVPRRPPNIAILAEDGALIANRGDTGGAGGAAGRPAALSPQGVRGDRGSTLLFAFRHRSGGHLARRSFAM